MTVSTLQTANSTVSIHHHGATVLSWKLNDQERLFLSSIAKQDGSKAIRGGVPLVFPVFGPSGSSMPQHGFARVNEWTLVTKEDAKVVFSLSFPAQVEKGCGDQPDNIWSKAKQEKDESLKCELLYTVNLKESSLVCTLQAKNTGSVSFPAQALLHTYLAVQDVPNCYVSGLEGHTVKDRLDASQSGTKAPAQITIGPELDRDHVPDAPGPGLAVLHDGTSTITVNAASSKNEEALAVSYVVWNPGQEKAAGMSDLDNDAYQRMVCVEPGMIQATTLEPGQTLELSQTIS